MTAAPRTSEADIWAEETDPHVGAMETDLFRLGSGYLVRVHAELHRTLGLPPLPTSDVLDAYHARRVVKARDLPTAGILAKALDPKERSWNKAVTHFERVRSMGLPTPPDAFQDLVTAATEKWYAEGRLASRARTDAAATTILGMLQSGRSFQAHPNTLLRDYQRLLAAHDAQTIEYASLNAAEHMQHLAEQTRHKILGTILTHEHGGSKDPNSLARQLLAQFGTLNRDWRRVAITETAFNRANGFLASLEPGRKVEWSAAEDACPICKKLHGKIFTVVDANDDVKNGLIHVWVGKATRGRDPLKWPAIPAHPHCRCRWLLVLHDKGAVPDGVNPEFVAYMDAVVAAARAKLRQQNQSS